MFARLDDEFALGNRLPEIQLANSGSYLCPLE